MIYSGISVFFACQLCKTNYGTVGGVIEHKKIHHFQEFRRINSIVFEEKIFPDFSPEYYSQSSVVPLLPSPSVLIKAKTPADADTVTNTDSPNVDSYSYFELEQEIEPTESEYLILEPKTEVIIFEKEILQNPVVCLERLSSTKIKTLLTADLSRNARKRRGSIAKPDELSGQDDVNFFHSHDDDEYIVGERNNKPVSTPVFERICKQENYTKSSNCSEAFTNGKSTHPDILPEQNHTVDTLAAEFIGDNETSHNIIETENIILRPFKCPHPNCPKEFRYKESVNHHFVSHSSLKPFKCPELNCGKKFKYNYSLKVHLHSHSDKSVFRRGHQPNSSGKKLNPEENSDPVTSSKRFKCPEPNCEKSFSITYDLQSHLHRHSDLKQFKCPVPDCGKTFKQKGSLYNHKAFHSDVIPFPCPYPNCGKSYKFKYSRNQHVKLHH